MFKQLLFATLAVAMVGVVHADADDFAKLSLAATHLAPMESTTAAGVPDDLQLDTAFDADGLMPLWPASDATWSKVNEAIAVFPRVQNQLQPIPGGFVLKHTGYYVVGRQQKVVGTQHRAWIARYRMDGSFDTSFGTGGWIFTDVATSTAVGVMNDIVDAKQAGNKIYILGNISFAGVDMARVLCIDLTAANSCFPAGFGGMLPFDSTTSGPRTAAYGQKLAYDSRYGLFVAAKVINSNRGQEMGVARIDATTGGLITEFGGTGYSIGLPNWANDSTGEARVEINALEVTPDGFPGGTRLYIGGQVSRSATDSDGFILGLGPTTGATATGWNWNDMALYYENDNPPTGNYRNDAVTALTVLRNGRIAWAGWSATNSADVQPMMLGRRKADGSLDTGFCAGNPTAVSAVGACLVSPPSGSLFYSYQPVSAPVAIRERRQNRDLVVVQRFADNGWFGPTTDDGHVRTKVQQFSANGNRLYWDLTIDYPDRVGVNQWNEPTAAWMGGTGVWGVDADGTGSGEEVLVIAGTRKFDTGNYDATLSHLKASDSIFADQFGGVRGD